MGSKACVVVVVCVCVVGGGVHISGAAAACDKGV
jgi:hypothetical protein